MASTDIDDFIKYFNANFKNSDDVIDIFDKGDVFYCYGNNAKFVSKEVWKSTAFLKQLSGLKEKLDYITFGRGRFEPLLRELLLTCQRNVSLYRRVTHSKQTEWKCTAQASPGNFKDFEDILFGSEVCFELVTVAAVRICRDSCSGNNKVGFACCDTTQRLFTVCEFIDEDSFTNLEAVLIQTNPKEAIIPIGDYSGDMKIVLDIFRRTNVAINERKKTEFSSNDILMALNHILKFAKGQIKNAAVFEEFNLQNAMGCLSALIHYLRLLEDDANAGVFHLRTHDSLHCLRIDQNALRSLDLVKLSTGKVKETSLYTVLNNCRTGQGKRLLDSWIRMPLTDRCRIEERLDLVEAFAKDAETRRSLHEDCLRKIPDLHRLAKKMAKKRMTLEDCYKLYQLVKRLPEIKSTLERNDNHADIIDKVFIQPLSNSLIEFVKFVKLIEETLDFERIKQMQFFVKAEFDEQLLEYRTELDTLQSSMNSELEKASRSLNLETGKSIKLDSSAHLGHCFRVSKKDEKLLRDHRANFTTIDANKSGVFFTNSGLKQFSVKYCRTKAAYDNKQDSLVQEIVEIVATYFDPLCRLCDLLARVDVIVGLAVAAVNAPIPYTRPVMHDKEKGILILNKARHPLLETVDEVSFISNDVHFERGSSTFHMIFGPNMGGKSTYIRQTAMCVIMAQIGSFVPCESAEISIIDAIYTRIGASDCIKRGISTFMAEMLETAAIVKNASVNSLVIIDELGRGTSTVDGFALAWAISEHIARDIGCFCMFATHFHELSKMSDELPMVKNFHVNVLCNDSAITMLYEVKPGPYQLSFGINVTRLAKFPGHIVQEAVRNSAALSLLTPNSSCLTEEKQLALHLLDQFQSDVKQFDLSGKSSEEVIRFVSMNLEKMSKENKTLAEIISDVL